MNSIFLALDLSEAAKSAACFAQKLAQKHKAEVVIYYNFMVLQAAGANQHTFRKKQKAHTDKALTQLKEIFPESCAPVEYIVSHQPPAREVSRLLKKNEFDLAVLPNGKIEETVGLSRDALLEKLTCPFLQIPSDSCDQNFEKVVFTTDFEDEFEEMLPILRSFVDKFDSRLHCLHIETKEEQLHHDEVTQKMDALKASLSEELQTNVLTELVRADKVVHGLEKYVEEHEPDLLIMYHKTHSFFERALKGKTKAQRAAKTLEVPLMILND